MHGIAEHVRVSTHHGCGQTVHAPHPLTVMRVCFPPQCAHALNASTSCVDQRLDPAGVTRVRAPDYERERVWVNSLTSRGKRKQARRRGETLASHAGTSRQTLAPTPLHATRRAHRTHTKQRGRHGCIAQPSETRASVRRRCAYMHTHEVQRMYRMQSTACRVARPQRPVA